MNTREQYRQAYAGLRCFFKLLAEGRHEMADYVHDETAKLVDFNIFANAATSLLTYRNGRHISYIPEPKPYVPYDENNLPF